MNINIIVEQALESGYLTPTMEAEVGRLCETSAELSNDEYLALDKLMGALLTGEIVAMPRKQFINVMEELVVSEVISRVAEIETTSNRLLDVGDISAYALNRLPPLYATTEEGASFQRDRAKTELTAIINNQVEQAISLYLERPSFHPERQALNKGSQSNNVFEQVTKLLQSQAPNYES
ncbi:MAG: late competence development ComFB family protein [Cyanobacterium sp.]